MKTKSHYDHNRATPKELEQQARIKELEKEILNLKAIAAAQNQVILQLEDELLKSKTSSQYDYARGC